MRAAPGEPRRGQIPVVQDANCRLNVSRRSGVLRTNGDRCKRNQPELVLSTATAVGAGLWFYIEPTLI